MSLNKSLDALTEADLQELITDRIAEQQTVDYKKGLYLESDQAKDEFRRDIASFANASGGHLIIGMDEKDGFPTDLCGMDIPNPDAFKMRVNELLQSKITPRVPGCSITICLLSNGKSAVVIRIPQSFAKPHQITVNKDDFQFWSRNSAGKYRLSVDELRSIILQSETLAERVKNFRLERLGNLVAEETPVPLMPGARTVLHMIPLSAFGPAARYDVSALENADRTLTDYPSEPHEFTSSYLRNNLEGLLSVIQAPGEAGAYSYLQVFRNGILEAVEAEGINWRPQGALSWNGKDENLLIRAIERGLTLHKHLGVEPPIIVQVTLLGVKGFTIYRSLWQRGAQGAAFDRDTLLLPDMLVEDLGAPSMNIVRPILDALWNAGGYSRCMNFNAEERHISTQ